MNDMGTDQQLEMRARNQWKLYMQRNLKSLNIDMEGQDSEQVDPASLIRSIEKSVKVPHSL